MKVLVTCLFAITLAACESAPKATGPRPAAEDGMFAIRVHRIEANEKHVRVWVSLDNRTMFELTTSYSAFNLVHEDVKYGGALRVPFTRVQKGFKLHPKMVKRFTGPLEFLSVPVRGTGILRLEWFQKDGATSETDLAVQIPIATRNWDG